MIQSVGLLVSSYIFSNTSSQYCASFFKHLLILLFLNWFLNLLNNINVSKTWILSHNYVLRTKLIYSKAKTFFSISNSLLNSELFNQIFTHANQVFYRKYLKDLLGKKFSKWFIWFCYLYSKSQIIHFKFFLQNNILIEEKKFIPKTQ